jgi:hypothetical protein
VGPQNPKAGNPEFRDLTASACLEPAVDEPVTITALADGYQPRSETLKLPEGATKALVLVLEKIG